MNAILERINTLQANSEHEMEFLTRINQAYDQIRRDFGDLLIEIEFLTPANRPSLSKSEAQDLSRKAEALENQLFDHMALIQGLEAQIPAGAIEVTQ